MLSTASTISIGRSLCLLKPRLAGRALATASMPGYHILQYKYVPDILERRAPYRADHIASAQEKAEAGKIVLAGAAGDPVDSAYFIWKDSSKEEIESFVKADPYVINGLVPGWEIKPYMVVIDSTSSP